MGDQSLTDSIAAYKYSLNQHVFRWLRNQILTSEPGYRPNDRLNSTKIANELGVSKTPVTSALNRLASLGLVRIQPRSGTYVASPDYTDVEELVDVLAQLDLASLALASRPFHQDSIRDAEDQIRQGQEARRMGDLGQYLDSDRAFHTAIVEMAQNTKLLELYSQTIDQFYLAAAQIARANGAPEAELAGHREIVASLRADDDDLMAQLVCRHWSGMLQVYQQVSSSTGEQTAMQADGVSPPIPYSGLWKSSKEGSPEYGK